MRESEREKREREERVRESEKSEREKREKREKREREKREREERKKRERREKRCVNRQRSATWRQVESLVRHVLVLCTARVSVGVHLWCPFLCEERCAESPLTGLSQRAFPLGETPPIT